MAKFRKRPVVTTAEQYFNVPNGWPVGVCAGCDELGLSIGPHVHTAHNNQAVELEDGDWIVPEPDGHHYYPIKPDIFGATYEPVID
jgi:hypothetical protein